MANTTANIKPREGRHNHPSSGCTESRHVQDPGVCVQTKVDPSGDAEALPCGAEAAPEPTTVHVSLAWPSGTAVRPKVVIMIWEPARPSELATPPYPYVPYSQNDNALRPVVPQECRNEGLLFCRIVVAFINPSSAVFVKKSAFGSGTARHTIERPALAGVDHGCTGMAVTPTKRHGRRWTLLRAFIALYQASQLTPQGRTAAATLDRVLEGVSSAATLDHHNSN
ncbi:hypothetical protein BP5796_11663 [Coleophoma crateriformis]|uniref:Uncharacterized protein n=1 Tax=Coleophoma crateriformis TaxID=565419 RepID=A0A3D8QE97_9HELO|nr:hypothetical protein BP5796_11663 [Coleophoma crateriformis]